MQMVAVMLPKEKVLNARHISTCPNSVFPGIRNDVKVQGAPTWGYFWQFSQSDSELTMSNQLLKREQYFGSGLCQSIGRNFKNRKSHRSMAETGRYNTNAYRTSVNKRAQVIYGDKVFQP
jgi:hypothetical protein